MKLLLLSLALVTAGFIAPNSAEAREYRSFRRSTECDDGSYRYQSFLPRYVDRHHPGAAPMFDRRGHLIDSHGHHVDRHGHHLDKHRHHHHRD
jgi:hypothetical protein